MRKLIAAAAALLAMPALANDSVAETAAGGLVLTRTDAIDMVSEDLFVSVARVRVAYVFRNRTARDVTVTVAFPMPDRPLRVEYEQDVAWPSDFQTRVEGRPVAMRLERKAVAGGRDVTALLSALKVPLSGKGSAEALHALPRPEQDRLLAARVADRDESDTGQGMRRHLVPAWTVRETWFWEQTFPAGRDLHVQHSYVPGAGGSVGTMLASRQMRAEPEARRMIADYCVDADFLAAIDRRAAATMPTLRPCPRSASATSSPPAPIGARRSAASASLSTRALGTIW
jgi:Domain of unknown function (DUF4424)